MADSVTLYYSVVIFLRLRNNNRANRIRALREEMKSREEEQHVLLSVFPACGLRYINKVYQCLKGLLV